MIKHHLEEAFGNCSIVQLYDRNQHMQNNIFWLECMVDVRVLKQDQSENENDSVNKFCIIDRFSHCAGPVGL